MEVGPKPHRLPINCPRGTVGGREVRIKLLPSEGPTPGQSGYISGLPWELIYSTDDQDFGLRGSVWGPGNLHHSIKMVLSLFSCSVVSNSVTQWTAAHQASLYFTISRSLLKLMSIESVMPSNYLILCRPRLLLPSIFPSVRVFFNESALHIRWPKCWSFSFSTSPSNEYSGLISFRVDWFDLLAVQGTLKSLLQHHGLKASVLRCSAFFMVHPSHPYMTAGKTIALTIQIFVWKAMSLLFNMLSRLVITYLPRSKHLFISCLQSLFTVILELKEIKTCHCFHFFSIYLP